ncbi:MAG: hypothetical protein ABIL09_24750 [Gemmatimonadota bacterium]
MLTEPTMEKLYAMKLNGMAEAWQEQEILSSVVDEGSASGVGWRPRESA